MPYGDSISPVSGELIAHPDLIEDEIDVEPQPTTDSAAGVRRQRAKASGSPPLADYPARPSLLSEDNETIAEGEANDGLAEDDGNFDVRFCFKKAFLGIMWPHETHRILLTKRLFKR